MRQRKRKWNANSHLELNPGTWFELPVYWPLLYVRPPGNHQPSQSLLYTPPMVLHNPVIHLAAIQYVPVRTSSEVNHKNLWEGLWTRSRVCSVLYVWHLALCCTGLVENSHRNVRFHAHVTNRKFHFSPCACPQEFACTLHYPLAFVSIVTGGCYSL